ncbi:MAG TPA: radical SAM protein [Gaiellales bacterium]|nr:radical SAM protein [Gaiellales bacterium]
MRWQRDDPQLELFGPEQRNLPTVEYMAVNARRIINTLPPSSRMPFRHTINAYRGCRHACTYCFARPTHEYLGLNSGEDFERRIVVKVNAVERLERELDDPAWEGESIAMGTNTDPYQPAEGHYRLTRGLVQVLTRHRNPFSILTKSSMILRDLDVLTEAARRTTVGIAMSIGTDEDDIARLTEPGAAPPSKRLEAISRLADAGLRPTVLAAPILPGISDSEEQVRRLVDACLEAGAQRITPILLHLRPGVREHYMSWLEQMRPELVGLHQDAYRAGAYGTKDDRARVAAIVSARVGEYRAGSGTAGGGRSRSRRRTHRVP